ncbi:hypothetical protein ACNRWW_14120 [Metabacillus sp. HB246100]
MSMDIPESRRIKRANKIEKPIDLFDWIASINSNEVFIYFLLRDKKGSPYDLISNLNDVKSSVLMVCDNKIENLKLLKIHFDNQNKYDFSDKLILVPLSVLTATLLPKILTSGKFLDLINNFFDKNIDYISLMSDYIYYFSIVLSYLALGLAGWNLLTKQKRRMNFISNIVGLCIDELDKENGKKD